MQYCTAGFIKRKIYKCVNALNNQFSVISFAAEGHYTTHSGKLRVLHTKNQAETSSCQTESTPAHNLWKSFIFKEQEQVSFTVKGKVAVLSFQIARV